MGKKQTKRHLHQISNNIRVILLYLVQQRIFSIGLSLHKTHQRPIPSSSGLTAVPVYFFFSSSLSLLLLLLLLFYFDNFSYYYLLFLNYYYYFNYFVYFIYYHQF